MCCNDMKNTNVKYETLVNANLKDEVMRNDSNSGSLENVLMKTKINQNNLFLVAEQELGKVENDAMVIINRKMKVKA